MAKQQTRNTMQAFRTHTVYYNMYFSVVCSWIPDYLTPFYLKLRGGKYGKINLYTILFFKMMMNG